MVLGFAHSHQAAVHPRAGGSSCRRRGPPRAESRPAQSRPELETYFNSVTSGSSPDQDRLRVLLDKQHLSLTEAQFLVAARMGDTDTVSSLLSDGVNVNVQDSEGSTALMRSASRGHEGVVRALLATGKVDLELKNNWGYDAVIYLGSVQRSMPGSFAKMVEHFEEFAPEADLGRVGLRWEQKPVYEG